MLNQLALQCGGDAVAALVRHLSSAKALSLVNQRLHCDLSALAALVSYLILPLLVI